MSRHKYTSSVCLFIVAAMLAITVLFAFGESLGIEAAAGEMPYVKKLFSTEIVHTIDIVADEDDWQEMLDNATAEEYILCSAVIDGDAVKNIGIRPKGNSSLTTIASSDSDRYSFKIEFDHYDSTQSYYGLDKLALNNIAQDNTYLKDYLTYQMMGYFGADAPLCSFIWITVNGQDWGLYLAVEAVEESFLQRNYGNNYGELYKPDSMNMGGGADREGGFQMPENFDFSDFALPEDFTMPDDFESPAAGGAQGGNGRFAAGGGGMGGFSSGDVALQYTDDEHDSYGNIFDNAKTDPSDSDKDRLIASIKQLNNGENLEEVVNIDEVLRYFVVHNFVLNFDSYTGSMNHNYYLYEENGVLSMIAWDYNLAFGAFSMGGMGGGSSDTATTLVNFPIDTPVSGADMEDRPLIYQLLTDDEYLTMYHRLFDEFITGFFDSGEFERMMDSAVELISPYVEKDPTAFCTYDEFVTATETLSEFCLLRAESVSLQLIGVIPATSEGQSKDSGGFIDASHLDVDAMGSQNNSFNRGEGREGFGGRMAQNFSPPENWSEGSVPTEEQSTGAEASASAVLARQAAASGEVQDAAQSRQLSFGAAPGAGQTQPESGGSLPEDTAEDAQDGVEDQNNFQQFPVTDARQSLTGTQPQDQSGTSESLGLCYLGASALILAAGLIFAKKYRT